MLQAFLAESVYLDKVPFSALCLSFQEYAMKDPLPLAQLQEAVLNFLKGRNDAVLFGAHGVNAYSGEPRATQDVDVLSLHACQFAHELRAELADRFRIAVRVREANQGARVYQVRQEGNRHLVDVREVQELPPTRSVAGILVLAPPALVASKVVAICRRRGRPKSLSDARDLAVLLLAFPELKTLSGPVADLLHDEDSSVQEEWRAWVEREILPEEDDY